MKTTDFILQTILMIAAVLCGLLMLASFDAGIIFLLMLMIVTGGYQVLSAVINTIAGLASGTLSKHYKIYWLLVVVYFIVGGLLYYIDETMFSYNNHYNDWESIQAKKKIFEYIGGTWFFLAWAIAGYLYWHSYTKMKLANQQRNV